MKFVVTIVAKVTVEIEASTDLEAFEIADTNAQKLWTDAFNVNGDLVEFEVE